MSNTTNTNNNEKKTTIKRMIDEIMNLSLDEKIACVVILILVFVCIRFLPKKLILNLKEVEEEYD